MKKLLSTVLALVLVLSLTTANALTLRKGSSGTVVKRLQEYLNDNGYSDMKVDGKYGTETVAAVKRYQKENHLKQDGIAGPHTLSDMGIDTNNNPTGESDDEYDDDLRVVSKGSTGTTVRAIQNRLKGLGYPVGKADGTFGAKTETAVKYFQKLNNLTPDGKVGPETYQLMMSSDATPYNASFVSSKTYVTMRKGSSGELVRKLQKALNAAVGFDAAYELDIDFAVTGYYSEATRLTVKSFQAARGLTVDGIAGKETQAALYAITGIELGQ